MSDFSFRHISVKSFDDCNNSIKKIKVDPYKLPIVLISIQSHNLSKGENKKNAFFVFLVKEKKGDNYVSVYINSIGKLVAVESDWGAMEEDTVKEVSQNYKDCFMELKQKFDEEDSKTLDVWDFSEEEDFFNGLKENLNELNDFMSIELVHQSVFKEENEDNELWDSQTDESNYSFTINSENVKHYPKTNNVKRASSALTKIGLLVTLVLLIVLAVAIVVTGGAAAGLITAVVVSIGITVISGISWGGCKWFLQSKNAEDQQIMQLGNKEESSSVHGRGTPSNSLSVTSDLEKDNLLHGEDAENDIGKEVQNTTDFPDSPELPK